MKNKKIPFGKLTLGTVAKCHIQDCIDAEYLTMGNKVKEFEKAFSDKLSDKVPFETVACNNGTSAVTMACLALYDQGAKRGDYIVIPGLSFIATASAVVAAGFKPYFLDVSRKTLNIYTDIYNFSDRKASKKTISGIIAVNTMGRPCNMSVIKEWSENLGVPLIVDNCEGHGCRYNGLLMEEYADMCCYSFYPAHAIVAGEMGAVTTYNPDIANSLQSIRNHGREMHDFNFTHARMGGNFKPLDIIAAVGLEGVEQFDGNFIRRKNIIVQMRKELDTISDYVYFSEEDEGNVNCPHAFSIVLKHKSHNIYKLKTWLTNGGIEWKSNFGTIPKQGAFDYLNSEKWELFESDYAGTYGVHWGCHQSMTEDDVIYVCDYVKEYFLGV